MVGGVGVDIWEKVMDDVDFVRVDKMKGELIDWKGGDMRKRMGRWWCLVSRIW